MNELSDRAVLTRCALTGLAVGVVVGVIWAEAAMNHRGLDGVFSGIAMIAIPVPLSGILARSAGISRWWLVALAGSVAFGMLANGLSAFAPLPNDYGLPETLTGVVFPLAGAAGYAAVGWIVIPRALLTAGLSRTLLAAALPRILLVGAMIAFSAGAGQISDRVRHWHQVRGLAALGVPLVVLDVPGHRHTRTEIWRFPPEDGGQAVQLTYHRGTLGAGPDWSEVQVFIRATATTPGQACAAPYPHYAWGRDRTCRTLSDGRVLLISHGRPSALFMRHGDVLLQIGSHTATEAELLAAGHVRPATAGELMEV
ncbi:hypothetical protein [Streptosporangium sp. 'caverna']|uniref:hypothetical protein n=1 Tax=Streptosporangium sp. 'caverna' TaxID=2202249 RepID=UPI000D7E994C|nr:hypothetical protein [Streptosporangium sp. 'caverna']AWS42660.1 hypothetical protein DKM19_16145 [Streptosporangium sp. 'caverna']